MKSINQFDYPSKQAQNFKNYSQSEMSETKDKTSYNKNKYKENLQYHMEAERNKVKELEKQKKQLQAKKNKARLKQQLEKKRKQLEELQLLKNQAEQNQRKSYELALLKEQQDKIRKQQEERKKKQFDQNAVNRFGQAMKRLYQQREQNSFKQRLAQQRRKTADQFERIQRIKANKYKSQIQEKNQQEKQISAEQYKKSLANSAFSKSTDYNKTCLHNLKIIPQKTKDQQNAFEKGKIHREEVEQKSLQKRKISQQNLRRSKQRGRQAWQRIQKQRQYSQFEKETQEQQKKYNLQRIQAGKKNQFIGLKPTTLSQMQVNKKQRVEQQFESMFFQKPYTLTESFNRPATQFQIIDRRMPQPQPKETSFEDSRKLKSKTKSYLKEKQQSQIPCVSQGKYSFQQPQYSQFKNHSRSHTNIQQHDQEYEQNQEDQTGNQYTVKNAWKQTGIPNDKYSSSPEQQKKISNKFKNDEVKQQSKKTLNESKFTKQPKRQQKQKDRQSFNTDDMLRKYGLKRDSPQSKKNKDSKGKNEGKRKVVQLANVCKNKQNQKQQLNYSSESQEDSNL